MLIAICVKVEALDSVVDEHFGRSPFFALVDSDKGNATFIPNGAMDERGAGVKAARILLKSHVDALIAREVGPKAYELLTNAGIRIFSGLVGTMRGNLDLYYNGALHEMHESTMS